MCNIVHLFTRFLLSPCPESPGGNLLNGKENLLNGKEVSVGCAGTNWLIQSWVAVWDS